MDRHKIVQIGQVKFKKLLVSNKFNKNKIGKVVSAYVFMPFAMKPLNKNWCNQLPSEVT
jgi:hypothetical protein